MTWDDSMGLAGTTTRVQVYRDEAIKDDWQAEADEQGYNSLSGYVFELVQEARAYRDQGFLAHHQSEEQIEQLKQRIDALEQQLQKKEQRTSGRVHIDDPEFLYRFLDTHPKSLEAILRRIVESGALDDLIRKPVEDQLYFLAQNDEVDYERGHGWKLSGGDE